MKTITYQNLLYRAAEAAGRTRDNIPNAEASLLLSLFAIELPKLWFGDAWPDLIPAPLEVAISNNGFANPYAGTTPATEFGEVLGVYSANPETTLGWERLDFYTRDGWVHVAPGDTGTLPATVFVHYMLPATDLFAVATADLAATTLPLIFAGTLAAKGAGHLLMSDGDSALAGAQFALAESSLAYERARITRPKWSK